MWKKINKLKKTESSKKTEKLPQAKRIKLIEEPSKLVITVSGFNFLPKFDTGAQLKKAKSELVKKLPQLAAEFFAPKSPQSTIKSKLILSTKPVRPKKEVLITQVNAEKNSVFEYKVKAQEALKPVKSKPKSRSPSPVKIKAEKLSLDKKKEHEIYMNEYGLAKIDFKFSKLLNF